MDVLIIIMAVVALAGSGIGVALYEPAAGDLDFTVTFSTNDSSASAINGGSVAGSGTIPPTGINITQANLTALSFAVTLSHSAPPSPQNIQYTVRLLDAAGNPVDTQQVNVPGAPGGTSTSGSVTVTVPAAQLNTLPADTTLSAADQVTAENDAAATYGGMNGTGVWTVEVTVAEPAATLPAAAARTHTASIVPNFTTYGADVQQVIPSPNTA